MEQSHVREIRQPSTEQDNGRVTSGPRSEGQAIASGRPSRTPFVLTGIVAMAVWSAAAVVVAVVFLVFWLS